MHWLSFNKAWVYAVIPFSLKSALLIFKCEEYGHLHVSCKKSSVDPNNAASAKCYDLINVLDQVVEHMLDALIVCPLRAKLSLVMVINTIVLSGAGEFLPNFGLPL